MAQADQRTSCKTNWPNTSASGLQVTYTSQDQNQISTHAMHVLHMSDIYEDQGSGNTKGKKKSYLVYFEMFFLLPYSIRPRDFPGLPRIAAKYDV